MSMSDMDDVNKHESDVNELTSVEGMS